MGKVPVMLWMDGLAHQAEEEIERFKEEESGVATIFACFMIMMMVLVGGIGVDLMHNEMERVRLQNTLDRRLQGIRKKDPELVSEVQLERAREAFELAKADNASLAVQLK